MIPTILFLLSGTVIADTTVVVPKDSVSISVQVVAPSQDPDTLVASELRKIGLGLLPYLDRLEPLNLNREQRARMLKIRSDLSPKTPDSPERIAVWLVEDESIWLALLDHDALAVREFATTHLSKRFPKSLRFEPSAGASVRADQIARLKTRLLR